MYALLLYALKTGACLAVFYLFFKLLLSRETFHRLNRAVVLSMLALSCLLPCCVVTVTRELPAAAEPVPLFDTEPAEAEAPEAPVAADVPHLPWREAAAWLWLFGAVCVLGRTLRSICAVRRIIRAGRHERQADGTVLVRAAHETAPFSWGRYIVLTERDLRENGATILCHERAHARLHHSADLLFCDLICCLQWFNPALWLLRADLRAIHEYEADEAVLESGADARAYQMLLIKKAVGERWYSVANSFNHSNLKNRITMMIQMRSPRWAAAKALLLLPLIGVALGAFAETVYVAPAPVSEPTVQPQAAPAVRTEAEAPDKDSEKSGTKQAAPDHKPQPSQTKQISVRFGEDNTVTTTTIVTTVDAEGRTSTSSSTSTSTCAFAASDSAKSRRMVVDGRVYEGKPVVAISSGASASAEKSSVVRSGNMENLSGSDRPLTIVNGKRVDWEQLGGLASSDIQTIAVYRNENFVAKYGEEAANGVVVITLKQAANESSAAAAQASATEAAKAAAQRVSRPHAAENAVAVSGDKVVIRTEHADEEGTTLSYSGRMTLNKLPDVARFVVNGREATRSEVRAIEPGKIRKMQLYKGADAVARYGADAARGVLEIRTRR